MSDTICHHDKAIGFCIQCYSDQVVGLTRKLAAMAEENERYREALKDLCPGCVSVNSKFPCRACRALTPLPPSRPLGFDPRSPAKGRGVAGPSEARWTEKIRFTEDKPSDRKEGK